MIGSANTARFSGRTVTHPDAEKTRSTAKVETPRARQRRRKLEVDTESSFVDLCIAIRVFGEDGQVARFEPNENAKAQGQKKAAAGARRPDGLFAKDELINVGKRGERAETEHRVRLDRPIGREMNRESPAVEELVAVVGQGHTDVRFEADAGRA